LDLSNFEGAEELNEKEKDLCSTGRIPPRTFLTMKQIIINAAQKNGSNIISKSQARLLCNVTFLFFSLGIFNLFSSFQTKKNFF